MMAEIYEESKGDEQVMHALRRHSYSVSMPVGTPDSVWQVHAKQMFEDVLKTQPRSAEGEELSRALKVYYTKRAERIFG